MTILGTFNDETDVDVYRFTNRSARTTPLFMPVGASGYGGTAAAAWMQSTSTTAVIARITDTSVNVEIEPPLEEDSDYYLYVSQPETSATDNPHYVIKFTFSTVENTLEAEPNDTPATAEPLELMVADDSDFILATLPDGDVDYFGFTTSPGQAVSVACGAQNAGSGIRGLTITLSSTTGQVFATEMEAPDANAFIDSVMVPEGPKVVQLSKTGQDPQTDGNWVRCGFFLE